MRTFGCGAGEGDGVAVRVAVGEGVGDGVSVGEAVGLGVRVAVASARAEAARANVATGVTVGVRCDGFPAAALHDANSTPAQSNSIRTAPREKRIRYPYGTLTVAVVL